MNVGSSAGVAGTARSVRMPGARAAERGTPAARLLAASALDRATTRAASPDAQEPGQLPREYLELYQAVEAQRTDDRAIVVQFIGALGGEGTTTVASGFARAAALATGAHAVIYIDCDRVDCGAAPGSLPPSLVEAFLTEMPPSAGIMLARNAAGLSWAWLGAVDDSGPRCSPAAMGHLFDELRARFAVVVLDCPAAAEAPEALSLARHCDGTLLVVQAERTRTQAVAAARDSIEQFGGQVIGTVFNRARRLPRWLAGR